MPLMSNLTTVALFGALSGAVLGSATAVIALLAVAAVIELAMLLGSREA